MSKQMKADFTLVLVTLGWGASYYLMDISLTEMDPFTLNSLRFLGAFAVAGLLSWKRLLNVNKTTLKYSLMVGCALVFVYIGATFGVKYTTLSNSAFLCGLVVVFTPLLEMIFLRKAPGKKLSIVLVMCFVGTALMTLGEGFSINMVNLKGDVLSLMCSVAYAIDLILTEKAVSHEEVDAYQLGVFQLGVTGVLNLALALMVEEPVLPQTASVWGAVIFLAVFCTGAAFVLQPVAQQYTTASHVGVIFALEPVFAAIVAYAFANEVLTPRAYVGAAIMLISIFVMEIDFKSVLKNHGEKKEEEQ